MHEVNNPNVALLLLVRILLLVSIKLFCFRYQLALLSLRLGIYNSLVIYTADISIFLLWIIRVSAEGLCIMTIYCLAFHVLSKLLVEKAKNLYM